jgi:hypothetical protein
MTPAAPRSYLRPAALLVIAAVVIGAGVFATTLFGTATTTPQTAHHRACGSDLLLTDR